MIQAAKDRLGIEFNVAQRPGLIDGHTDKRRLVIEAAVCSDRVIVLVDVIPQQPIEMAFIEWNDVVEKLTT